MLISVDEERQAIIQAASWRFEPIGLAAGLTISTAVFQQILMRSAQEAPQLNQSDLEKTRRLHDVSGSHKYICTSFHGINKSASASRALSS